MSIFSDIFGGADSNAQTNIAELKTQAEIDIAKIEAKAATDLAAQKSKTQNYAIIAVVSVVVIVVISVVFTLKGRSNYPYVVQPPSRLY